MEMHIKMQSAKWRPLCSDFSVLVDTEDYLQVYPDSKVHGANMGHTWVQYSKLLAGSVSPPLLNF